MTRLRRRRRGRMRRLAERTGCAAIRRWLLGSAATAALALAPPVSNAAQPATTQAGQNLRVIDGDTLQSGGDIIQLYGIDAPELGQLCRREDKVWQCGVEAAFALQKLVALSGMPVVCVAWYDGQRADRPDLGETRVCQLGNEQLLGLAMLSNGYALALPGSFPYYGLVERTAREANLGLWSGEFDPPWDWRDGQRTIGAAEECNVKGAVTKEGHRLYLVPTDDAHEDATVNPAEGERSFCSDEEARQAGWRRPGENGESAPR